MAEHSCGTGKRWSGHRPAPSSARACRLIVNKVSLNSDAVLATGVVVAITVLLPRFPLPYGWVKRNFTEGCYKLQCELEFDKYDHFCMLWGELGPVACKNFGEKIINTQKVLLSTRFSKTVSLTVTFPY